MTNPGVCGDVFENVYRPYLPDPEQYLPQYDTITNIAARLTTLAEQNILANGGYVTTDPNTYHIPDAGTIVSEPEKPDPCGPAGLVAEAIASAINVTTSAAVEYHISTSDRENLDAIIDGITDNSYNGHKPYYSYLSNLELRPDQDWYQLNFSQPVKFDSLTFYEGDIQWLGINTYYINDNSKGGFFKDLTVQIMRDGKLITPADLQISPELDRFKMYQTITFTFTHTVGSAIRIIGTPGGTDGYTTIMELKAGGDIDVGLYIASVRIADGQMQRSDVNNIKIKFSRDVTVTKDDIEIAGTTNATVIDMNNVGFDYNSLTQWLTLSLSSSLPDDTYQLRLDCNDITDSNGLLLLDDDQIGADGFYTIEFHRLFGDADGSAAVDLIDFSLLSSYWLDDPADTGLDSDQNNILNLLDMAAFVENWLVGFIY